MELSPEWTTLGLVGLFVACFLAGTVLPLGSEAVLAAMALGPWGTGALWGVASVGNWLGGMSGYGLGRLGDMDRIAAWLRADRAKTLLWSARVQRHGSWAALLCWAPVAGDPIAIALGLVRARLLPVALFMLAGKAARYAVVLAVMRG